MFTFCCLRPPAGSLSLPEYSLNMVPKLFLISPSTFPVLFSVPIPRILGSSHDELLAAPNRLQISVYSVYRFIYAAPLTEVPPPTSALHSENHLHLPGLTGALSPLCNAHSVFPCTCQGTLTISFFVLSLPPVNGSNIWENICHMDWFTQESPREKLYSFLRTRALSSMTLYT